MRLTLISVNNVILCSVLNVLNFYFGNELQSSNCDSPSTFRIFCHTFLCSNDRFLDTSVLFSQFLVGKVCFLFCFLFFSLYTQTVTYTTYFELGAPVAGQTASTLFLKHSMIQNE